MSYLSESFLSEIPEKASECFLSESFLPKVFHPKVFDFKVLENSSQRASVRSCDGNTATQLADKREIGRFMGFPVPY